MILGSFWVTHPASTTKGWSPCYLYICILVQPALAIGRAYRASILNSRHAHHCSRTPQEHRATPPGPRHASTLGIADSANPAFPWFRYSQNHSKLSDPRYMPTGLPSPLGCLSRLIQRNLHSGTTSPSTVYTVVISRASGRAIYSTVLSQTLEQINASNTFSQLGNIASRTTNSHIHTHR